MITLVHSCGSHVCISLLGDSVYVVPPHLARASGLHNTRRQAVPFDYPLARRLSQAPASSRGRVSEFGQNDQHDVSGHSGVKKQVSRVS